MSEFTQVSIRRGTEGLGRAKGFWSGKEILFNQDESTIYVLDETTTTQDLIDTLMGEIDANIRDWVLFSVKRSVDFLKNGKAPRPFCDLQSIPSLQRPKWMVANCRGKTVSLRRMLKCWEEEGKSTDQLSEFLADEWVRAWRQDITIFPCMQIGVPREISKAKLLTVRWDSLDGSSPLETFLQNLWNLTELDFSGERFLGSGTLQSNLYKKKNFKKLRDGLRSDEWNLLDKYGLIPRKLTGNRVRALLCAPLTACLAIIILAKKGLLLASWNLRGDIGARIREAGLLEPFDRYFKSKFELREFYSLLIASTIRKPEDIPADVRDRLLITHRGQINHNGIRRMLYEYAAENSLPGLDLKLFERGASLRVGTETKKWRTKWFRDQGYPAEWCEFAEIAFNGSRAGNAHVSDGIKCLCEWALDRFKSPWDIKPLDLINPHHPNSVETFYAFCKADGDTYDPAGRWSKASSLFKRIKNACSIPGFPGYRPETLNPFEYLENPFRGKSKVLKTHRSRISTLIHEKLLEILLDLDENGKPTFNWAKRQYFGHDNDIHGVWHPSRWTALAILLLLPLRKKSVRWLDQGLMDEKVFDPETFKMVDNTHRLRNYTYEDGQTHLQRYGRPSGVIQQMTDDFMGTSAHIGLFANTNKTQLWNPERRNGYELPWPDGRELLASDDKELQQYGLWLRRVYEVFAYQYRHVIEHDPDPRPVTFTDVLADFDSVSADPDRADRMPRFVPLFRDTKDKKQLTINDENILVALPVSDRKIEFAYTALCMELEIRLRDEGYPSVSLTMPATKKGATKNGINSRKTKFDIHCLRVAGISRLIEMGIDPVIVQEFVAGHLTPAMTHHYMKLQPWHVREKIIEAILNGDFKSGMETSAEKVTKGVRKRENTYVGLPRFQDHVVNLPEDFACFSVVRGGICVMGGKGDACNEGGVYERQRDGKDTVEIDHGPVQGGCGNCIYFRTAAFLLQEQTLVLNILLAELRAQARERKELRTKISELACKIDEAEGANETNRLISDKSLHESRIEELNHNMVPRLTEWVNRYIMLKECESQLDALLKGNADTTALVAPFGENIGLKADDLKVHQEMTPDIGLIGRIVEGSRVLGARGIAVPEDHARFLERGVDKLLRMNGSEFLLLDVPDSERVQGASMMFNALEDLIGVEAMQHALDSETPLALTEAMQDNVNQFAEVLVGAAKRGKLTIDSLLEEGRSCKLISDTEEGGGR